MGKILCVTFLASITFCVFGLPYNSYIQAEIQDANIERYEDSPSVEEEVMEEDHSEDILNELANMEEADEIESASANREEDFNDDYGIISDDEVPEEFQQSTGDSDGVAAIPKLQAGNNTGNDGGTPAPVRCGRSRTRDPNRKHTRSRGPDPGMRYLIGAC